ncbi:helicase SNF2, partial [Litorilinea aerophila]
MIQRFSSRRHPLDRSYLCRRLQGARAYDRIAGYFRSSLLEIAGETLESVQGPIRVVCNSDLSPLDVQTAQAAKLAMRREWMSHGPERLVEPPHDGPARERFARLYRFLCEEKLQVRVLPNHAFGLIHGKAGVITLADGRQVAFLGSTNETREAWRLNYELLWEDDSPEAVAWVQEEFDALWGSPYAFPLAEAVVEDIGRLARRRVLYQVDQWFETAHEAEEPFQAPDPGPAVVESPVYRRENGLWPHQKYFVKLAYDAHYGPWGKARFVLADQVGLGKTLQLALTALLIGLSGERPILILAPKTLLRQWQAEMWDLLAMPSAVWTGKVWLDEQGVEHPFPIRRCPRRVGLVSAGLITRRSAICQDLLSLEYDCVILDEAHRARRRNLHRPQEKVDPNNLLRFMQEIAPRTRSLLLATATPVQLHPIEAWDLLDVLARGDDSVLGNEFSFWRRYPLRGLALVMGSETPPANETELWEWVRNPLPPKSEGRLFERLRRDLDLPDQVAVAPGDTFDRLRPPTRQHLRRSRDDLFRLHNPFIRRIVRRTRTQLEQQRDPETGEPLLQPIQIRLFGEGEHEALLLPPHLREAYELAEMFCRSLGERMQASGFLKTLLLRRTGSSIYAGQQTARRILDGWQALEAEWEEDEEEDGEETSLARSLTPFEQELLRRFLKALSIPHEEDPKYAAVRRYLLEYGWLHRGCIIFSQYFDSIRWLAEKLTQELPSEVIGVYSGPQASGLYLGGECTPRPREEIKQMVARREIRLLLGTDAASEGLNLQRLGSLINLDLPWNPTRLEQRKGRIQRIGQVYNPVYICNLRYKDSVEDRVHQLLSTRLQHIYGLFGQLPDVLEDAWIAAAMQDMEQARRIIDSVPQQHPFDLRYTQYQPI